MMNQGAWVLLARIAAGVLLGALAGGLLGDALAGIAVALAAILAFHVFQLLRFERWLRERSHLDPPDASGMWGEIIARAVRLHRRKRFHKQRLLEVMREIRQSTSALPDGVVMLNARGEIGWFNRMAGQLLGLRRREDVGANLTNLVRDPQFVRYLGGGQYGEPLVVTSMRRPGQSLSFQIVPYGGNQRLVLVRDVSRQVQLESLRKDFVANASHELRSPLTVIIGYMETLDQDDGIDAALRGPLAEMRRQAQRMNAIIRDLLELSRLDASKGEAGGEPIDVAALATVLRKDVLARPVHPRVTLHIESDARVTGDEGEIHSAFANLVDNAAKYTPAEGSIDIRWSVDSSGDGRFSVRDTGPGIPAEHLPRLTERFYRVDPGRSRATGGSGLGLAIVKHALQHHGASLEIESTEGVGSTFTCRFPARRVSQAARGADTALN